MFTVDVKQHNNNIQIPKFYIAPYSKINGGLVNLFSYNCDVKSGLSLRPDFTSKLVHGLALGTPKFYIASYSLINPGALLI